MLKCVSNLLIPLNVEAETEEIEPERVALQQLSESQLECKIKVGSMILEIWVSGDKRDRMMEELGKFLMTYGITFSQLYMQSQENDAESQKKQFGNTLFYRSDYFLIS